MEGKKINVLLDLAFKTGKSDCPYYHIHAILNGVDKKMVESKELYNVLQDAFSSYYERNEDADTEFAEDVFYVLSSFEEQFRFKFIGNMKPYTVHTVMTMYI